MVVHAVPVELLDRFLGGEATREVIRRCTKGPVIAKRGSNGSFSFPLVHPQVIQHTEALGIGPHIEENAFLYLDERDGTLEYVVAVGENKAVVGYGVFERTNGPAYLASAARLSIQYVYDAGSIQVVHVEDGLKRAHTPIRAVEIREEELERLVEKYVSKSVSDEEVKRCIAEQTELLHREIERVTETNKSLQARLRESNTARVRSETRNVELQERARDLETQLETAKVEEASRHEYEALQQKYDRADRALTDEKAARAALEGKLAEEKGRYASLDATHRDFLARHQNLSAIIDRVEEQAVEIHGLKEALAATRAGSGPGKPIPDYPAKITSKKDRLLYDLAQSLMRRCIAQKRYREDDQVGLGLDQKRWTYHPLDYHFSFYDLRTPQDIETIAATDNTSSTNEQRRAAIAQFYGKQLENYHRCWFPGRVYQRDKIPVAAVLFFQLMKFGRGPLQSGLRIQEQLGFTQEQMKQAREQGVLRGSEKGIERISLNETMKQVYTLFIRYRHELYQQCTAQSL